MQKDIFSPLTEQLLGQIFTDNTSEAEDLGVAKLAALHHSRTENAIAVLSNIRDNSSVIVCGRLGRALGIPTEREGEEVSSIWEEKLLERVHPDDVVEKLAQELQFITFVKSQPEETRHDFFLQHVLRMRDQNGEYAYLLHRIFYLNYDRTGNVTLALCLYTMAGEDQHTIGIINSLTGKRVATEDGEMRHLLSDREKEVLRLIGKGRASKEIADILNISTHTVNCHRQNILKKMHVVNSTEAHNVARKLGIL